MVTSIYFNKKWEKTFNIYKQKNRDMKKLNNLKMFNEFNESVMAGSLTIVGILAGLTAMPFLAGGGYDMLVN